MMKEFKKKEMKKRSVMFSEIGTPLFLMFSALCLLLFILIFNIFTGECVSFNPFGVWLVVFLSLLLCGVALVASPYYKGKSVVVRKGISEGMKRKVIELSSRFNLISGVVSLIAALVVLIYYLADASDLVMFLMIVLGLLLFILIVYLFVRMSLGVKSKGKSQLTLKEGRRSLTPLIIYIQKLLQQRYKEDKIREILKKTQYTGNEVDKAMTIAKPIGQVEDVAIVKHFGTHVGEEALKLEEVTKDLEKRIRGKR